MQVAGSHDPVEDRLQPRSAPTQVPERFEPSKRTLFVDRFMTQFIKIGGVSIIVSVFAIFLFILWQILPLFQPAKVEAAKTVAVENKPYLALGIDEWGELPFLLESDGTLSFVDLSENGRVSKTSLPLPESKMLTAFDYTPERQILAVGTNDGLFATIQIQYRPQFRNGVRKISYEMVGSPFHEAGYPHLPVIDIAYADSGTDKIALLLQDDNGVPRVSVVTLTQQRTLFGTGETAVGQTFQLSDNLTGAPEGIAVNAQASDLLISSSNGDIHYYAIVDEELKHRQTFNPFDDLKGVKLATMNFLLGGASLVVTGSDGTNRIFGLFYATGGDYRTFGQTKEFDKLSGPADFYARSLRNKAFLIGSRKSASLRYGTTADTRWESELPFTVSKAVIGGKYDRLVFLDTQGKLHIYRVQDHHPETSFQALFGKVWYEGANEPKYEWQSTGGTDDFEPKLSLVPLIIGTIKGTIYAMLFAVPIALLAAVYTSQFLHPDFRVIVKPTMEIMASLPSVVLGFLAALWVAPLVETRVPSLMLIFIGVPLSSLLFGWIWSRLPIRIRLKVKPGFEWLAYLPVFLVTAVVCWQAGPVFERIFFVVTDPDTGSQIADFRRWWPHVTGLPFEQRNSLVVGFMMGFAVIPIIFTITEDALSNVPPALTSGSLALGASRWQTAVRIVLPTASAGIFSAIMIGLGRAVGETMIVVMATGNTPIMDLNIFSGMRTLSANVAVELPEAPVGGTLYRTLFLGGMVLFILTFSVNTLAEILRQHLREKYKTV